MLLVSELKVSYKWKHGKVPKAGLNKPDSLADRLTSKDTIKEGAEDTWTLEEEAEINRLKI